MAKVNFEETFEIYLFTDKDEEGPSSKLSVFLSYLKYNKVNPSYKFSYVGPNNALLPELSLSDNILLDYSPNSLTEGKDIQFQEFLKEERNHDLERLYKKLTLIHELPGECDTQMKKICSLLKSLVFEGQFIFLEHPECDLDQESLDLFIKALKGTLDYQNVFIFTRDLSLWMPHAHKLVTRNPDFSFSTKVIENIREWEQERKDFYKIASPAETKSELHFHFPKKDRKKSA